MEIKIFDIRQFTADEYDEALSVVSDEKRRRIERFRNPDDKKRCLAGDMLARQCISESRKINKFDIIIKHNYAGKPFAANADIHFNISHSGDYVICAVSDSSVGVDIEQIRSTNLTTAKRFCTDTELKYIFNKIPDREEYSLFKNSQDYELLTRFFKIWTLKEAYFKCIGTGIAENLKSVEFHVEQTQVDSNVGKRFLCHSHDIEGYIISACY